jgi:hypothetical protein
MKKIIWISIGLIVLIGCGKHEDNTYVPGKIITNVKYTGVSVKSGMKSGNLKATNTDSKYTGFGDFIMSITPNKVTAKFYNIRYVSDLTAQSSIELINNNLPPYDSLRYADFTNNSSISMKPSLGGDLRDEGASFANIVEFEYLTFDICNVYHAIQLPQEYIGIDVLDQFNYPDNSSNDETKLYSTLSNNILNARYQLFLNPLYGYSPQVIPTAIVFGGTDSSYVINLATDFHDFPYNTPYHGNYIIRSKNYNPITFIPSESSNKTTLINATLSFDYNNLIQIYAGNDNIPFTRDDIFLYEPNFFDRLTVNVTIE